MTELQMLILYASAFLILSVVTYFLYLFDKKKAIKKKWRTPESTLLMMTFLLGSVGGLLGLYQLRHKNKHWYFVLINWVSFLIHFSLLIFFVVNYIQSI